MLHGNIFKSASFKGLPLPKQLLLPFSGYDAITKQKPPRTVFHPKMTPIKSQFRKPPTCLSPRLKYRLKPPLIDTDKGTHERLNRRGICVENNYRTPQDPEDFVQMTGRQMNERRYFGLRETAPLLFVWLENNNWSCCATPFWA